MIHFLFYRRGRDNFRGRGRGGFQDGGRGKRVAIFGWRKLQEVKDKEPEEIILELLSSKGGFKELINRKESISADWVAIIMEMISKVLDYQHLPQQLLQLLNMVKDSAFLLTHLTAYLTAMTNKVSCGQQESSLQPIKNILMLFRALVEKMPNSIYLVIPPLVTLEFVVKSLDIDVELETALLEVISLRDHTLEQLQKSAGLKKGKNGLEAADETRPPPNDFHEIPIFPDLKDIHLDEKPFLRANKNKGGYEGVDHYLDVQFRLLREDFIRPLREGILSYLKQLDGLGKKQRLDIRLYEDVRIITPVCTGNGIAHTIRFDVEPLKRVRWQSSKRLIYGSLVCLSRDNFNTMLFATVCDRKPENLQEGELQISFENHHEAITDITPDQKFLMAETSAYFEAYRHVLKGMQETTSENFPFQKYIVRCETTVKPPRYLLKYPAVEYDLQPLIDVQMKANVKDLTQRPRIGAYLTQRHRISADLITLSDSDATDSDEDYPIVGASPVRRSVKVLNTLSWPKAETLHLDESQLKAVQTALTKEFAIIQGPPGTGKTYIGLKIVKALLHNKSAWAETTAEARGGPILVVCYTNHALDQFLEGIQKFYDRDIVRVGGRSQNKSLEKYLLRNIKSKMKSTRGFTRGVHDGVHDAWENMGISKGRIERTVAKLEATERGVLNLNVIEEFMLPWHVEQMKECTLLDWLLDVQFDIPTDELHPTIVGDILEGQMEGEEEREVEEEEFIAVQEEAEMLHEQRLLDEEVYETRSKAISREERQFNEQEAANDLAFTVDALDLPQAPHQEGWQTVHPGSKKKRKQYLRKCLRSTDVMTDEEEANIRYVWQLPVKDRWRLYRKWAMAHCIRLKEGMKDEEREFHGAALRMKEMREHEDMEAMRTATILGMTTTGAARYHRVLQQIKPKIIIVEEAAEVLESHIVTTLSSGCEHLILIGDHKQLRPNPTVYDLATKYNLEISLFERMVNNGMNCECLELQHRMRPEISSILCHIYPELRDHDSVREFEDIRGVTSNIFFIDHGFAESQHGELRSRSNVHEATYIAKLCKYFIMQGYEASQITVLTPYTGQLLELKKHMPKQEFEGVRVTAVDNFQGEENDIILLSLVRSNTEGSIGFLKIANRVCVALSRAKKGFFVIGNFTLLTEHSELWSKIVNDMRAVNKIGNALTLVCQNHPETKISAVTSEDFKKAPEGGCQRPCEHRLSCGHVCTRQCHSYDREHTEFRCMKKCQNVLCELGHKCGKKCSEECGRCMVPMEKVLPLCQHKQTIACSKDPHKVSCKEPCPELLSCGHMCQSRCGEEHTVKCQTAVTREWPCGHVIDVACCKTPEDFPCNTPCSALLDCGHTCSGNCGQCKGGRLHMPCQHKCGRNLICSHACIEPCTSKCPPCKKKCQNRCIHSKCKEPSCGSPCKPCQEPCSWKCKHFKCEKLCSEPCDRPRCTQPCEKLLKKCNHPCIGLCGEPCPRKCRVCDKEEVTTILFGHEDEPEARFIQLEDCRHFIEVTALDEWMDSADDSNNGEKITIKLKGCPVCRTPIRRNMRYGEVIKQALADIEEVKRKIIGDDERIEGEKKRLKLHFSLVFDIEGRQKLENYLTKAGTIEQVGYVENQMNFLKTLLETEKKVQKLEVSGGVRADLPRELKDMKTWILLYRSRMSDQQLKECSFELSRLSLLASLLTVTTSIKTRKLPLPASLDKLLGDAEQILTNGKALSEDGEKRVRDILKRVKKLVPATGLRITEKERVMVVEAMGLSQGHWFKCPKGQCVFAPIRAWRSP